MDVNQTVNFSVSIVGGLAPYEYFWRGLPADCSEITTSAPVCTPASPGLLVVRSTALDGSGVQAVSTSSTTLQVHSDPMVSPPVLSAATVFPGQLVKIAAVATGGEGNFSFSWLGLPPNCRISGSTGTCATAQPGVYYVAVRVEDDNGYVVESPTSTLVVTGGPPSVLGLSLEEFAVLLGVIGPAAVVALETCSSRIRRSRGALLGAGAVASVAVDHGESRTGGVANTGAQSTRGGLGREHFPLSGGLQDPSLTASLFSSSRSLIRGLTLRLQMISRKSSENR
jgi:hypothetical protein